MVTLYGYYHPYSYGLWLLGYLWFLYIFFKKYNSTNIKRIYTLNLNDQLTYIIIVKITFLKTQLILENVC